MVVQTVLEGESETHAEALSHVRETEIADIDDAYNMSVEDKMSRLRERAKTQGGKPSM